MKKLLLFFLSMEYNHRSNMEHFTAIKVIENLAQDINLTQDPKNVLIKYAEDKNLSPAELERLGQVYNSAKTLSHLEKSANRGDTYNVLDIEDLVKTYMGHTKEATVIKQASTSVIKGGKLPNLFNVESLEKAASEETSEFGSIFLDKMPNYERESAMQFLYELPDTIHELKGSIQKSANHIARSFYLENINLKDTLEKVARDSAASSNKNSDAILFVAKKAVNYFGEEIQPDLEKYASAKVVKDTTGWLNQFSELQESIDLLQELSEIAKSAAAGTLEFVGGEPAVVDLGDFGLGSRKKNKDLPLAETVGTGPDGTVIPPSETSPADSARSSAILDYLIAKEIAKNTPADVETSKDVDLRALDALKNLADNSFESLVAKQFNIPAVNRGYTAAKVDKRTSSIEAAATIHELMQDPVISAHSPQMVVSLYNSLSQVNPTMMRDKNVAKFALREALQYEGVTPHTYAQLAGIEKDKADTKGKNIQIQKEIYGKV
jgi:hypothetical protein